jgi:hypothetical protein
MAWLHLLVLVLTNFASTWIKILMQLQMEILAFLIHCTILIPQAGQMHIKG